MNAVAGDGYSGSVRETATGAPGVPPTALNGTTIQVIHSDAEGRMVLADTLALAARNHLPGDLAAMATEVWSETHFTVVTYAGDDGVVAPLWRRGEVDHRACCVSALLASMRRFASRRRRADSDRTSSSASRVAH